MNPDHRLVTEFSRLMEEGKRFPLGGFSPAPRPNIAPDAPKALFFSPHPDDECITGGPALRLLREARMNVFNVAVTQGSRKDRQEGRLAELKDACNHLGIGLLTTVPGGLERINPKTRTQDPTHWAASVRVIANIIQEHRPRVILFPHDRDWNSSHIGTHYLVLDALATLPPEYECHCIETEFWGAIYDPNLMVEISKEDLGDMLAALSFHVGEVQRNPYHLSVPAWMMDNVRRGSEVVGGQGGGVPEFAFAVICRLGIWKQGKLSAAHTGGKMVPAATNIATLFA
jgi:LmbE family N-acetylglucosaminyl deacetylase